MNLSVARFNGEAFSQAFQYETIGVTFAVNSRFAVYSLSREMVQCFFDIPFVDAARVLGVSVSTLRHIRDWTGHSCWPFKCIVEDRFELKREDIVRLRLLYIQHFAGSGDVRFPMFLEAERLSPIFKTISTPTKYAYSSRIKVMLLNPVKSAQLPSKTAMAVNKDKDVFKRSAHKRMVCKRSVNGVAGVIDGVAGGIDGGTGGIDGGAGEIATKDDLPDGKQEGRPPLCPLSYVKDCVTPAWVKPESPPTPEIVDGINTLWPVMDDPRHFLLHDLLYPRFKSRPVGRSFSSLAGSVPLNAIESRIADGFLKEDPDSD